VVIALSLVTLTLLALGVNAALLNGRPAPLAAAGLIPVVIALSAVTLSLVGQRAERASELEWQASAPAKAGSADLSGRVRPALSVDVTSPDLPAGYDARYFWRLRVPGYPELSEAEQRGLAYKASLRPPGLSAEVTIPVAGDELHWWRGAAGGLLLIGLLGVVLRGSREA
jgi:hypothetical protein